MADQQLRDNLSLVAGQPMQPVWPEAKAAFAVIGTILVSTGSVYGLDRAEAWRHHIQPRVQFILDAEVQKHDVVTMNMKPSMSGSATPTSGATQFQRRRSSSAAISVKPAVRAMSRGVEPA